MNKIDKSLPNPKSIHTLILDLDGVFTDNKVIFSESGQESVLCSRGDGYAFNILRAFQKINNLNINVFILSTEPNQVVAMRGKKLKISCYHGEADKLSFVRNHLRLSSKSLDGVLFLGNDLNDLALMKEVRFSVSPLDGHPLIRKTADLVMPYKGGDGFIRAFIELWIGLDNMTEERVNELISYC
mgnify:CR=1 FL=1